MINSSELDTLIDEEKVILVSHIIETHIKNRNPVTAKQLASELNISLELVREGYKHLTQKQGGDPLLLAADQCFERARKIQITRQAKRSSKF